MITRCCLAIVLTASFPYQEIKKAEDIVTRSAVSEALDDPYVVSAIYYHEEFLSQFNQASRDQHPCRQIIASIKKSIRPEFADSFVAYIKRLSLPVRQTGQSRPVNGKKLPIGGRHKDAIDIFIAEGSSVFSIASGIVVLAEGNWDPRDPSSSSSSKGGNTVIVFDPKLEQFIRFCHLATVNVKSRQIILAGDLVGTVGHTGTNASRNGHGHHLHLEINKWDPKIHHTDPLSNTELKALVQ